MSRAAVVAVRRETTAAVVQSIIANSLRARVASDIMLERRGVKERGLIPVFQFASIVYALHQRVHDRFGGLRAPLGTARLSYPTSASSASTQHQSTRHPRRPRQLLLRLQPLAAWWTRV